MQSLLGLPPTESDLRPAAPQPELSEVSGTFTDNREEPVSSDSKYRLTLDLWASQHVPPGARITRVDVTYDDGHEPTFTDRPASLWVGIGYVLPSGGTEWTEEIDMAPFATSITELLTALFTIEETNP